MIISHSRRFVFMHTPKTAGGSITKALVPLCGPDDIITGGLTRRNDTHEPKPATSGSEANPQRTTYGPHTGAKEAQRLLGEDRWREYFTFAVERNPWDKAVSRYYWRRRKDPNLAEFSTWLRQVPRNVLSQTYIYCIDEEQAVDRVLRFENLVEELDSACRSIGITGVTLPSIHAHTRPSASRDWRTEYTDEDAAFVADVCRREIELFDYAFD